jgi:hypothetical protein
VTDGLPETTLPPGLRVLEQLGLTPEGPLYRAEQADGREVELMLLQPELLGGDSAVLARLREWFSRAMQIRHPNVAAVREVGETETGQVYVVSESLLGELLSETLARRGALPPAEAMDIWRQAAAGLQAAHKAGWAHGNLSPDTILLTQAPDDTPRVKLIHFTLPSSLREAAADGPSEILLSPEYASPERIAGQPPAKSSDVFSLGAVLHHLLTGAAPGSGSGQGTIPQAMRAVITQALAPAPTQRFQTIGELALAVEGAVAAAAAEERRSASVRRPPALGVVAVVLVVLVVVAMGLRLRGSLEGPAESALLRVSQTGTRPPAGEETTAPPALLPSPPPAPRRETAPLARPRKRDERRARIRAEKPASETVPGSPRVADTGVSTIDTSVAPTPAPEPAPPTLEERAQVYHHIGLDEASRHLGGPIHAIEGMSPVFIGLAEGQLLGGATRSQPVVRAVYIDPNGKLILLDQQRIRPGVKAPAATLDRWAVGNVLLHLHGEAPPMTIGNLRRRVR